MTKAEIVAKFEEYKDRPIEISISGGGDATFYGNIDGHWLFIEGDHIVAVAKNTPSGRYDIAETSQREKPFTVVTVSFEDIAYIKSYIAYDTIATDVAKFTPAATSKSLDEIIKELQSDSINNVNSTRGFSDEEVYGSSKYGRFKGSAISTSKDGLPKYLKEEVESIKQ